MSEVIPQELLNQLKATNGQVITCKAAVAWEPKKPLDITDIQVSTRLIHTYFLTHSWFHMQLRYLILPVLKIASCLNYFFL